MNEHGVTIVPYKESIFGPDRSFFSECDYWAEAQGMAYYVSRAGIKDWPSDEWLTKKLSDAWTVPSDGRVELGFTKEALYCTGDNWKQRIAEVEQFAADLAKIGAEFFIMDYSMSGIFTTPASYSGISETPDFSIRVSSFQLRPDPGEDQSKIIRNVQQKLYRVDETRDNQKNDTFLPFQDFKMIKQSVARVERVVKNQGRGTDWPRVVAPWRRTM